MPKRTADGTPRVGQNVHYSLDRRECFSATITQVVRPESIEEEFADARTDLEDYQPVTLSFFAPGATLQSAKDVAHSPDKIFPQTWHTIDECPEGR